MGLRSRAEDDIPVGTVWPYYGTAAPTGWLLCDGGSTAGYAALAAQIGATTPDLRGRVPVGAGQGSGLTNRVLGATAGAQTAALAEANMPAHDHGGGSHGHSLAYHTHLNGEHYHSANGHTHNTYHDHGPHAHGGVVMTGHGGSHGHGADWGQVASSPQGYFVGQYAGTHSNGSVGYNSFSTGGGYVGASAAATGTGTNNLGAAGGATATVSTGVGSGPPGTAFDVIPPARGLQFIIKT